MRRNSSVGTRLFGVFVAGCLSPAAVGGGDCNGNGIPDNIDIVFGESQDCNGNFIPDECDIADGTSVDKNGNGVPDECDVDCNNNGISDDIEIADGVAEDCNLNGIPDECDIGDGKSADANGNGVPDECDPDCNHNLVPDDVDIAGGFSDDQDGNGIPDECDAAPRYSIVDLGAIADLASWGQGVNNDGEVVGYSQFCCLDQPGMGTLQVSHGFLWSDGSLTDLGALEIGSPPCSQVGCESRALAVNDAGLVIGWTSGEGGRAPVVWLPEPMGAMPAGLNLLPLLDGFTSAVGLVGHMAINEIGQIVSEVSSGTITRAVRWDFDGNEYVVTDLGTLRADGGGSAFAAGINDSGQVVGLAEADGGDFEAFIRLPEPAFGRPAGMTSIATGVGLFAPEPVDIDENGRVLGRIGGQPWLWLPEAALGFPAGFSEIPIPAFSVWPSALNSAGQILGTAFVVDLEGNLLNRAVLWHEGTWFLLNDLIPEGPWNLRNFTLLGSISETGFITGDGLNSALADANGFNPVTHGYLLVPLIPGDVNGDGTVNILDLIDLLLCFGLPATPGCESEDLNGDGMVNVLDLIDLLLAFGTARP